MPPAAVLLVLGAAVCHGVWNLLLKTEPRRLDLVPGALATGVLLTAPAALVYPLRDVTPEAWGLVVLSGLFETGYFFALSAAYGAGDLSLVYPIARGTAPVLVTPLALVLLGERLSPLGLAGIALVVGGIFGSYASGLRAAGFAGTRRAVGLAFLTGVMTSGYSLVNKAGVRLVPVPLYGFLAFAASAVCLGLALRWRGQLCVPGRARWGRMLAIGALMMAAYIAVLLAMSLAPVSYVVAGREVSIVVGAALGAAMLKESGGWARVAGAVAIVLGLAVMALSR